jgi:putative ABC transport system permease protein
MNASRAMFWRILRRQIFANRGRLLVVLLALSAGAAITAALLNLQVDAKRRLTTEFRAFGANVVVTPKTGATLPLSVYDKLPNTNDGQAVNKAALLYAVAEVSPTNLQTGEILDARKRTRAVIVGYESDHIGNIVPRTVVSGGLVYDAETCDAGEAIARKLGLEVGGAIKVGLHDVCFITRINNYGGPEDSQIFSSLHLVDKLLWPEESAAAANCCGKLLDLSTHILDRVNIIQLNVPGASESVYRYISALQTQLPDLDVRPIRQFSETQGKIYEKISGLLTATVVLVLILTALCVLAAMTNVAMERRNDVGLMKAIGGATRRVARLFLTEAALLGLVGGLFGAAVGILLSMELGKAVFGVAARPRLIVYPVAVGLTMIVAIASAYPLRRLAGVRPASVFRGEA